MPKEVKETIIKVEEINVESIAGRIKQVRKDARLSMDAFGSRIGVNSSSVAKWEKGTNNPRERTIRLICNECKVNYERLTKGEGEMYTNIGKTILDMLAQEYKLSEVDKNIMEMYLMLTDEQREGIHIFVDNMIKAKERNSDGK